MSSARAKHSFSRLPLPPSSEVSQHNLTLIDPSLPSRENPHTAQRRSQTFPKAGHWARVTPLPIAFPYRLPRADTNKGETQVGIEEWLRDWDVYEDDGGMKADGVEARLSEKRARLEPELIGLSSTCIEDDLPHLDIGNALAYTGQSKGDEQPEQLDAAAQEMVDCVSGKKVLVGQVDGKEYGPWSSRYAGHQFGVWAGQLGDGRATSILETKTSDGKRQEIQLKGSGRTPFSRSADGLAVLRSGVREFLCAEAMAALGIPTSRALSLCTFPLHQLQVVRENGPEPSSVLARVAPTFLRIGSFEVLNPPEEARHMQFFMLGMAGGGHGEDDSLKRDWEGLRTLGEWVAGPAGLALGLKEDEAWAKKLVMEVATRNAKMVAAWQVYGFCHGVINTDNVSVLGITIDYGPYAFMDVYDPFHICNHSDHEGRYDYRKQPTMIMYAINSLVNSLAEVIGCEELALNGKAILPGWADGVDEKTLEEWGRFGADSGKEVERSVMRTFKAEHKRLYLQRFGLRTEKEDDLPNIVDGFLNILAMHELDFHASFRVLSAFQPTMVPDSSSSDQNKKEALEDFLDRMADCIPKKSTDQKKSEVKQSMRPWLKTYAKRILDEEKQWQTAVGLDKDWQEYRCGEMRKVNPRFVLRQWLLEETIKKLEEGEGLERRRVLAHILKMATDPFKAYGGELLQSDELDAQQREERRLCGFGAKEMLGFQCSCSS
ncbi:hypothetical protein QFC19_005486 [Naganishia cerealis]|uniref:Uncharacterized protein n=1 Tax=Naganishia cerealis TaxID=610337 RepID=A0ACC2VN83_9TREE|nr:hypothetical protein QFC19_005486 [Naganishia cerealis]